MEKLAQLMKQMQKDGSPDATDMVYGVVTRLEPLEVRVGDRLILDSSFIELSNGVAASNALALDDVLRLIKYSKGQKYFALEIVGKNTGGVKSYNDLEDLPTLNTNNSAAQSVSSNEIIKGSLKLHKIAKTGNYNDLLNKPDLSIYAKLGDIADVGFSGDYGDLSNTPTIPDVSIYVKKAGDTMTGQLTAPNFRLTRAVENTVATHYIYADSTGLMRRKTVANVISELGINDKLNKTETIVYFLGGTIVDY